MVGSIFEYISVYDDYGSKYSDVLEYEVIEDSIRYNQPSILRIGGWFFE